MLKFVRLVGSLRCAFRDADWDRQRANVRAVVQCGAAKEKSSLQTRSERANDSAAAAAEKTSSLAAESLARWSPSNGQRSGAEPRHHLRSLASPVPKTHVENRRRAKSPNRERDDVRNRVYRVRWAG